MDASENPRSELIRLTNMRRCLTGREKRGPDSWSRGGMHMDVFSEPV